MNQAPRAIRNALSVSEHITWAGQPSRKFRFRPAAIAQSLLGLFMIVFLVPFFSIGWNAQSDVFGWSFLVVPIVMLGVGAYMVFGRYLAELWIVRRLHYALTNRRVFSYMEGPFGSLRSLPLDNLPYLELTVHQNGTGSILFELKDESFWFQNWRALVPEPFYGGFRFYDIPDVEQVYRLVERELENR